MTELVDLESDRDLGKSVSEDAGQGTSTPTRSAAPTRSSFEWPKMFDTKPKKYAWAFLGLAVVVTAISVLAVSFKKVDSTEYGLEYNVHNKQLDEIAKGGGLHIGVSFVGLLYWL